MNKLVLTGFILVAILVFYVPVFGQIYTDQDTMGIGGQYGSVEVSGDPGDTIDVYLYFANPNYAIGGYLASVLFDGSVITPIGGQCYSRGCALEATQFNFSNSNVFVVNGASYVGNTILRGSGPVTVIHFEIDPGAELGIYPLHFLENVPFIINAWTDSVGSEQIVPVRRDGYVNIGGASQNLPPVIGDIANQQAVVGQTLQFNVSAHDPNGDSLTLSANNVPANASFPEISGDSLVTGLFTFTPDASQAFDTFYVEFRAIDENLSLDTKTIRIIVYSTSNLPPIIDNIGPQAVSEGSTLEFTVVAHDSDADPITLSASNLPPNSTFPQAQGDSIVSSIFTFQPDFSQGPDTFVVTFSAADDHNNVATMPVQIIVFDQPNDWISIGSDQGGIPGAVGRPIDISLYNTVPVYGIQFEFSYDPEVISISEVNTTYRSNYLWFNSNEPEPGRIIVMMFSVGLDSIAVGQGPITEIVVDVLDDTTFGPTDIAFQYATEVIDSIGTTKVLETENGYFTVDRYGDANLDGSINVGDCLSIVAYIIGVHSYTQRQMEAADFNGNGFVDIGDLQDIVNFILEIIVLPQGSPEGPPVEVELLRTGAPSGGFISVPLNMELPTEASAVQFEIRYNSDNLNCTDLIPGEMMSEMAINYNVTDEAIKCVIYNLGGGDFGPASGELVELEFELIGINFDPVSDITISEFAIVNPSADFMPVEIRGQLPSRFTLNQNYPNPFNAATNISFNLPEAGQVELQVYDLLGRSVVTLHEGFLQAGSHTILWDGRSAAGLDLASGVYFYRLQAGSFDETKKMLLIK